MKKNSHPRPAGAALCLLLAFVPRNAKADSSCWSAAELKAYDITMQTLMLAHVASDCDAVSPGDASLRARLATFLGQNGAHLDADRAALGQYFRRAYGEDWETPMQSSLKREETRVNLQVKQSATPEFCTGAADALKALTDESWDTFIADAQARQWHQKAGLPQCP